MALAIKKPELMPHLVTSGYGVRDPGVLLLTFSNHPLKQELQSSDQGSRLRE